jgi:hypothetical protein
MLGPQRWVTPSHHHTATHPFHQGRTDSMLATASMISLAKILRICRFSRRTDWNRATNYFTQNVSVWLDRWAWRKIIYLSMVVFFNFLGKIFAWWEWDVSWCLLVQAKASTVTSWRFGEWLRHFDCKLTKDNSELTQIKSSELDLA